MYFLQNVDMSLHCEMEGFEVSLLLNQDWMHLDWFELLRVVLRVYLQCFFSSISAHSMLIQVYLYNSSDVSVGTDFLSNSRTQ